MTNTNHFRWCSQHPKIRMDIRDRGSQICRFSSDFSCSGDSWDLSVGRGRREQAWEEQQGQEKGRALRGNFPDALFFPEKGDLISGHRFDRAVKAVWCFRPRRQKQK